MARFVTLRYGMTKSQKLVYGFRTLQEIRDMATDHLQRVVQHLRQTSMPQTDGQLLDDFIARRDEAAFAAIVRRHGPMILGVCRRLLPHHDAEDAFQATFLVLVRKAESVKPREMLGNWLYGVAYHIARKARALAARRYAKEKQVADMPQPAITSSELREDLRALLDRELSHLPDIYRVPIICCDLEGKTRPEAARQLGWSEGTLSGRLSRARAMLAKRLSRRGLALSAGSLATALSQEVSSAGVPCSLLMSTVRAGSLVAAGQAVVSGVASLEVASLTEGVLKAMWMTKLKITTAVLVTACAVSLGGGGYVYRSHGAAHAAGPKVSVPVTQDPTEEERLEKLIKQLDEQIRKAEKASDEEQARKRLEELLQKVRNRVEVRRAEKVRAAAAAAQKEIDKVLEGLIRKENDKQIEIAVLDEIEKAVKEMKRKAKEQAGQPKKP